MPLHIAPLDAHPLFVRQECGFDGNSDLYGLGIRLGYYAQAFATWFATFFVAEEGKNLRPVNILFLFAMVIGLFVLSFNSSTTYSAEAFLLLQIISTTWFVGTLDITGYSREHWKSSTAQVFFRELSTIAVIGYNLWFWWFGLNKMLATPCGTRVFFVVPVNLYGFFRRMHQTLSVIAIFYDGFKKINFGTVISYRLLNRRTDSLVSLFNLAASLRIDYLASNQNADQQSHHSILDNAPNHLEEVEIQTGSPTPGADDIELTIVSSRTSIRNTPIPRSPTEPPAPVGPSTPRSPASSNGSSRRAVTNSGVSTSAYSDTIPFSDLYDADCYLDDILASFNPKHTRKWQLNLFHNKVRIFVPNLRLFMNQLIALTREISQITLRRNLNLPIIISTLSFIVSIRGYAYDAYIPFLLAILTHPSHPTRPRKPLHLMKRIRLSRLPPNAPKMSWVPWASFTGLVCIGQVLAVELVLRWNHVTGLAGFGTVGQLVPFVLGVGGLGKVLWEKGKLVWKGSRAEEGSVIHGESAIDALADAYYARKRLHEEQLRLGVGSDLQSVASGTNSPWFFA